MSHVLQGDRLDMLIGGERVGARSGELLDAHDPATGRLLARIPRGGSDDAAAAVDAGQRAFPAWRSTALQERIGLLLRLADRIEDCADELAQIDVADNGSPIREMGNDALIAVAIIRHLAGAAPQVRGQTIATGHERLDYTLPQPYGVVGRIVPFNHPFMFAATKIAAPLLAGNSVVLKPSEHTSLSALRLADLVTEVFPPGVVNIVTGTGDEAGDALVAHPAVRRLAFIGSVAIGRSIQARAAGVGIKTVTLELGGKNPIVVFDDADLDAAIDGAVRGMNFTWQGQSCGSTSRLLVHRSLHADFLARLGERLDSMRAGDPADPETETGAIVHRRQYDKVLSYLQIARDEGLRLVAGGAGAPATPEGMFVRPTLFDGLSPDSRLFHEEIFGPVLGAMPFDDEAEALELANAVDYGLTASVYTRDLGRAHRMARDLEAGYVWVNDASRHFLGAPYGGFKDSGIGREEGIEEIESYTQVKNVNVNFGG